MSNTIIVRKHSPWLTAALLALAGCGAAGAALAGDDAFIPRALNSSTIPANGDLNPYGVAFVPDGFPSGAALGAGDLLISNFNNSTNVQGTGTTIVRTRRNGPPAAPGSAETFFSSALPGLSTALGVLRAGFVVVGSVPTTDGSFATIGQGALQVIDRNGNWLQTWTDPQFLDGPWDLTIDDHGSEAHLFISNVLNGTVSRLDVAVTSTGLVLTRKTTIAAGYRSVPNAAAVVLGPTGLAYDGVSDTLYMASTADNAIFAVSEAAHRWTAATRGERVFASSQLRGPLALRWAPNGDLLTANGDAINGDPLHPSEIVEFTIWGQFVREYDVDASQGGAFGIDTLRQPDARFDYAAVDDVTNSVSLVELQVP